VRRQTGSVASVAQTKLAVRRRVPLRCPPIDPARRIGPTAQDASHTVIRFLATERLFFREWSAADAPLAVALWCDPTVGTFIGGPFPPEHAQQRLRREIETQTSSGVQYWPIFLTSTGSFAGCCGLRPYQPEQRIFEIGFHFLPAYWGQGLAGEAAQAVIRHAFDTRGAAALFAGHHPDNAGSARLLQRLGFRYTHDEHYAPTGRMHPSYLLQP